jgi:hypothetical protein
MSHATRNMPQPWSPDPKNSGEMASEVLKTASNAFRERDLVALSKP